MHCKKTAIEMYLVKSTIGGIGGIGGNSGVVVPVLANPKYCIMVHA